jgi:hypothetical protein
VVKACILKVPRLSPANIGEHLHVQEVLAWQAKVVNRWPVDQFVN